MADDIAAHRPVAVATVIAHVDPGWVGRRLVVRTRLGVAVRSVRRAPTPPSPTTPRGLLAAGRSEVLTYGPDGQRRGAGMEVFVASYAPRPRMLVFGAIDFAAAARAAGLVPRLPGHRVRRPPGVRDAGAVPDGRRGRRRVAATATWRRKPTRARSTAAP